MSQTNSQFAAYLKMSLESQKLRDTQLTLNFVSLHDNDNTPLLPSEPTVEIQQYAAKFVQKKMTCTDSDFKELMVIFSTTVSAQTVKEEEIINISKKKQKMSRKMVNIEMSIKLIFY